MSTLGRIRREVERNAIRARNGIRMVTGISRPTTGQSPKDVVWQHGRAQLWRYHNDDVRVSPPLLMVFSLFSRSYIMDLTPGNSFVEQLVAAGFDVYLLDWGVPDERDAANQLEDYVDDYLPAAIARAREVSGSDEVNLLGYCFGGFLTVLHAAHHPGSPLRSLTVLTTPVDLHQLGPMGDLLLGSDDTDVESLLDDDGNVPAQVIFQAFKSLQPTAQVTGYVDLFEKMWSDEYVAAYQAMVGWANDHVPLPGGVARQLAAWSQDNALVNDRIVLGGDRVHLSDITLPFLSVVAERDHIVPPASTEPLLGLVGSTEKQDLRLDAGHIGLAVGRTAARTTIPTIIDFLHKRSEVTA